jgi:predicted RNase H-like nuclease (RuvC/YqgF family)
VVEIIIGFDAGAWSAFAAVDLEGRVAAVESRKNWSLKEVIERAARFDPIAIACDTNPPSKQARKLATAFSAKLVFPKHSLTLYEKNQLAAKAAVKTRNSHERDAVAAALKAFHLLENKLRQLRGKLERAERLAEVTRASERVLHGERMSDVLAKRKRF